MKNKLLQKSITDKFSQLRRGLVSRILQEGIGVLIIAIGAAVLFTLLVDYFLRFEMPVRVVLLAGIIGGLGYLLWQKLLAPLRVKMPIEELALLVESRNKALRDRLISSLDFEKMPDNAKTGMSPAMIEKMASQANEMADQISFNDVIERKQAKKVMLLAMVAVLLIGGLSVGLPDVMGLWFQRNVLLAEQDWPQQVYLNIFYVDNNNKLQPITRVQGNGDYILLNRDRIPVLHGENLTLVVVSQGAGNPDEIDLTVDYPSAGESQEDILPAEDEVLKDYRTQLKKLGITGLVDRPIFVAKVESVVEEVDFYIRGGDDKRDKRNPHKVEIIAAPSISKLQFSIQKPAYFRDNRVETLKGVRGTLSLPLGARLIAEGTTNKDLQGVKVVYRGKTLKKFKDDFNNRADSSARNFRVEIELDGINLPKIQTGKLEITLKDKSGYQSKRPETYMIQIKPDKPPVFQKFTEDGIGGFITPQAQIPLLSRVKDDHGVDSIRVDYQITRPIVQNKTKAKDDKVIKKSEEAKKQAPWQSLKPVTKPEAGTVAPVLVSKQILDIEPDASQGEKELPAETIIRIRAIANDTLPGTFGGPNEAVSKIIEFKVVSRERILELFSAKQRDIKMEFDQMLEQHILAMASVESVRLSGKKTSAEQDHLSKAQKQEQAAIKSANSVAKRIITLAREMQLNRVGEQSDYKMMRTQIATPLQNMTKDLDLVSKYLGKQSQAIDINVVESVYDKQKEILAVMRKIEKLLGDVGSRIELVQTLESIIKLSEELLEGIERVNDEGIDDEFDD